jgi:hypothetical protein
MRKIIYIGILIFLTIFTNPDVFTQSCNKFHLYGTCMLYPGSAYKYDAQSRSNVIGVGDKLVYNVIFYGERDYKLIFCATELFNPVHYVLTDSETKEIIFDNEKSDYVETVDLKIEFTKRIMIEVSVLALDTDKSVVDDYFGCVGLLLQYKQKKK